MGHLVGPVEWVALVGRVEWVALVGPVAWVALVGRVEWAKGMHREEGKAWAGCLEVQCTSLILLHLHRNYQYKPPTSRRSSQTPPSSHSWGTFSGPNRRRSRAMLIVEAGNPKH